jgi:Mrp family chromosome partitioning ATPase
MVNGAIRQMYSLAQWEGNDILLVDLPPGTSDANLTVFQSIALTGVVIVTSPQDLVSMIVRKSISMAMSLNIPVLGLVENMAWVQPPGLAEPYYLYGDLKGEAVAAEARIYYLGNFPIRREFAQACDSGKIGDYQDPAMQVLAEKVLESEAKKGRFQAPA